MDCCSKYPTDYTRPCHHTIPSVNGISSSCSNNSLMSNPNLYGPRLVHPSLRYQSTLNRNGFPPPIGYDGFGPSQPPPLPPPTATLGNVLPPHPYQNYDLRYDPNSRSYSNFVSSNGSTPLYPYSNSNGFSYGHLNNRFYNHHYHHQQQHQQQQQQPHYYDNYGRIIGSNHPYSYQHHHNYHTIRNSGNPATLNGSNSAYHHVYGHRQNSPYHPMRALDYHITPPTQYYSSHQSLHHQSGNSLQQHLYPSHTLTTGPHNDILQQNYSVQQQSDQSLQNNLTKDSIFLPNMTSNTPSSTEQDDETNRYTANGMNKETTDIDCDGIIEINSNSDKEINARCNSTQSIVNSPSENSTTLNTNNDGTTIFNSELTVPSSPLTNGSADSGISGCGNIGDSLYQNNSKNGKENYDNDNSGQLENDDRDENCENKQNIKQMISINDKENNDLQSSDVDSTDLKEPKSELNSIKDTEKVINRISDSNKRKLDCSTPLINNSPILERSSTPFVPHQQYHQQQYYHNHNNNSNYQPRYLNSSPATSQNNNYSSYYQNCQNYTQSNRSNWSPYSSPHYNYSYSNYSPTSTIKSSSTSSLRKQRTPISNNRRRKPQQLQRKKPISKTTSTTSTLLASTIINKNRVLECDFIPSKKSKRKNKSESDDSFEFREEIKDIKPLPGFQQAFGSTEIGRFSEIFFNTPSENQYDNLPYGYESEADTSMSPNPWETGDSLEGPHFNLHIGAASLKSCYTDHLNSIINDSPLLENNNYFSGIRCSEY